MIEYISYTRLYYANFNRSYVNNNNADVVIICKYVIIITLLTSMKKSKYLPHSFF